MWKKTFFSDLKKIWLIIPFVFVLSIWDIFMVSSENEELSTLIWFGIFGRGSSLGKVESIVMDTEGLAVIFFFGLLFGTYLSHFFGSVSLFLFTRLNSRRTWLVRQIVRLGVCASLYIFFWIAMEFGIALRQVGEWRVDVFLLYSLAVMFGLLLPLFMMVSLAGNWISIKYGETIGICGAGALVIGMEFISLRYFDKPINMLLNPICFNIDVIHSAPVACAKILIRCFYTILLAVGMINDVEHMDIY